jgi:hypothetical protein
MARWRTRIGRVAVLTIAGVSAALVACGGGGSGGASGGLDASVETGGTGIDAALHDAGTADGPSAGDDGATPTDAGPVDGSAGIAFCDGTYGALRAAFDGCCTSGDKNTAPFQFIDAIYAAITTDCETALSSAIAKGRVAYDPSASAACLSSFQQRIAQGNCWTDVDTNQPAPPIFGTGACKDAVAGLQGAGAPCAVDFECKDGLTCVGWTGATDGTCAQAGAAGKPCEQAPDAGSAAYFDWGFGSHPSCAAGAYCVTPTCKAQGGSGAVCSSDDACTSPMICHLGKCDAATISPDGSACDEKVDCQQGLYCALPDGGTTTGTCTPRVPLGGDCTTNGDQCKGWCDVPDGGTAGICATLCGSG